MDENGRKRQTEWEYVRRLLKNEEKEKEEEEEEEEEVNLIASSNKLQL